MKQTVDTYRWKTRIQPALILMVPAALTVGLVVAFFGDPGPITIRGVSWGPLIRATSSILAFLATDVGLVTLLEQVVRAQGKRKEPSLWKVWRGAPTTRMLRHSEAELSSDVQRRRLHEMLKALVPAVQMPTKGREERDPEAADEAYEEYVRYLRNATRDEKKFPLVLSENIHYGFARNIWAMRYLGITISVVSVAVSGWLVRVAWLQSNPLWIAGSIVVVAEVVLCAWWVLGVTPAWVLVFARAYAERLFEACDTLVAASAKLSVPESGSSQEA